jgi:circadian clock protein KaiC
MSGKINICRLETGVPGLDSLLGGGLPEFSFNLIAGTPGSGKTTLAHQIMFSLATPDNRAIFFTVLGEPALKMLRYQQQFSFFDINKVHAAIRFVNLSEDLINGGYDTVLKHINDEMADFAPSLVFVDSFRSVLRSAAKKKNGGLPEIQRFMQNLAIQMTSWQATTFLIGEYQATKTGSCPVFTVADGILWLSQNLHRNAMVRKMQVIKIRGQAQVPGLHSFRISNKGIHVFPRAIIKQQGNNEQGTHKIKGVDRIQMGVPGLDEMLGGGLPAGYSLLVVGPSGSGKTIMATEFLAEGVRRGECGVVAAFEKSPNQLMGGKLNELVKSGHVGVVDTRSLDLSIDETLHDLIEMIAKMQAKRVVIDSLSGFELALAPQFSEDFRGSLYRMVAELTNRGVTVLMTSELEDRYTDLRFSPFGSAFLADAIIVQRYIEIAGQFKRVLSVVKVRGSKHSKDIRLFDITDSGIVIGKTLSEFTGILSGRPVASVGWNAQVMEDGF